MPRLLSQPAVPVAYDLALWFLERARAADGHLPAQKLQNLLYLACVHYGRANGGRPLASLAFVANEVTVVDPNLYRLLEEGRPKVRSETVPTSVGAFLGDIWTRYGHATVEHLNAVVERILESGNDGDSEPIPATGDTSPLLGRRHAVLPAEGAEQTSDVMPSLRPSHRGRQVAVSPWRPPSAPKKTK
jgi:uncharacterized phage-associated protein